MNVAQIAGLLSRGVRITYEQYLRDVLAPAHLRGPWSQKWFTAFGAFAEIIWTGAQRAADVGFPATAPDDALDEVGYNENIERLIDEPAGTYRDRLLSPFDTWTASGRMDGSIQAQLEAYGLQDVEVYDLGTGWDPGDGNTYSFNRFWIVARAPTSWRLLLAGEDVSAGEEVYAGVVGMSETDARNIRRIVHKWRSKHSAPVSLYLIFSGTLADTTVAAAEALVAAGDAEEIPITAPWAADDIQASDELTAGWYIEPI
ncbi:hypothetical protein WMF30_10430 [Sorangium sp. So ce134]